MPSQRPGLSRTQQDGIASICAIGADKLSRVAARLNQVDLMIDKGRIQAVMVEEVGKAEGEELLQFLFALAVGARQDRSAPFATLDRISSFVRQRQQEDERLAVWPECQPVLAELLNSNSIRAAAKALDVSYDFERVYQAGRFITSVRPIFDDARERILGAAIVHTLRLEYTAVTGEFSTISISLDGGDIEQLQQSCAEALRKGAIAANDAETSWGLPTFIPGLTRTGVAEE